MENALQPVSVMELAKETMFTPRQIEQIKTQIMPGASDDELALFITVASSRGLDPFRKHIYAVSRRANVGGQWVDKWSYQVSIDGLRLIAQRSGRYEGQTAPQWCGPDGTWRDVWLDENPPAAARVGVYVKDNREPLYAVALYRNFVQRSKDGTPTKFWLEMPEHMISKVAESLALRKAFPEEAGGIYTPEEMGRGDSDGVIDAPFVEVAAPVVDTARKDEAKKLWDLAHDTFRWDKEDLELVAEDKAGKPLANCNAAELKDIYMELVGTSAEERAAILEFLRTPETGKKAS